MEFTLPLPELSSTNGLLYQEFTTFYSRFLSHTKNATTPDMCIKTSVLLFAAHGQINELCNSLKMFDVDLTKLNKVLEMVEQTCLPYFLLLFERFRFFTFKPDTSENLMDFVKTLKKHGELCDFGTIRDSIMANALVTRAKLDNIRHFFKDCSGLCFDDAVNLNNKVQSTQSRKKTSTASDIESQKCLTSKLAAAGEQGRVGVPSADIFNDEVELVRKTRNMEDEPKTYTNSLSKLQKKSRQFLCKICSNKYQSRRSLRRHMSSKHSDFPCKLCKKTSVNGVEMVNHCKFHAAKDGGDSSKFLCWNCDKPFFDQALYRQHCLTHSTIGVFRCDLCQTKHSVTRIIGHVKGHLTPRYKCEVCASNFSKPQLLTAHKRIHSPWQVHPCSVCCKTFVSSDRLQQHMSTHLGKKKRFACELCSKSFSQKMSYDYHTRWHAGEKPYECETCGTRARTSGDLRKHRRIHSDKRPYMCEVCGKSFRCISNLNRHRKSHSGKRSYVCDVCGRTFIYVEGLSDHIKNGRCLGRKMEESQRSTARSRASKDAIFNIPKTSREEDFHLSPSVVVHSLDTWSQQLPPETLVHEFPSWQYTHQSEGSDSPVVFLQYYNAPTFM